MQPVYLIKVEPNANNNKYYRMIPNGDTFVVEYGRVGANSQTISYPISLWDKKYREKIKKGYNDNSKLMSDLNIKVKNKDSNYLPIKNNNIAKIVELLQSMAKQAIRDNYTISSSKVTQAMMNEAQNILTCYLGNTSDVQEFNKYLLDLFRCIPRSMRNVNSFLAYISNDISEIISREQDLLDVMQGQVVQNAVDENNIECINDCTILDAVGIEFYETSDKEVEYIKKCLGSNKGRYKDSWRVVNKKRQKYFDTFVKNNNINNTTLFWHGSRNENWWSIINTGLVLRPTNAIITGKMFGYGLYLANSAGKSLGYTSISGSRWANGGSNKAFLALMDTAYGKPYDVYSFDSKYYNFSQKDMDSLGTNCLHAHSGNMLNRDEIVVYQEEQTTIKYLVEIA